MRKTPADESNRPADRPVDRLSRREFSSLAAALTVGAAIAPATGRAAEDSSAAKNAPLEPFDAGWSDSPDRVWLGAGVWANPMEDWRVEEGAAVCQTPAPGRNVHCLTRQLGKGDGSFEASVLVDRVAGERGEVGFEIGIHDEIDDYRGWPFFGRGIQATYSSDGTLKLADRTLTTGKPGWSTVRLTVKGEPSDQGYHVTLTAANEQGDEFDTVGILRPAGEIFGNVALVHNPGPPNGRRGDDDPPRPNARFAFSRWTMSGTKFVGGDDQAFGPILWCMHTLSDSRSAEGLVLKLTALLPPLGESDEKKVRLEVGFGKTFEEVAAQEVDPDAWTATFRVPNWPADKGVSYRVLYDLARTDGEPRRCEYHGRIRTQPTDRPLKLGALTCQYSAAFPYGPLVERLTAMDPDMLYFSGDQIYEGNGGFGIVREPAERAILNYLRKYYMFGWAFGDLMRDRPTVCIPDDHDVFQGNIWGEGGKPMPKNAGVSVGGYIEPVRMVNVVHETNCSHHPDLFDPTPIAQGMSVYYGDMVYGRVSFAILSDRQFKSGPERVNADSRARADHITDPDFDLSTLDAPGLELLGDRQEDFLRHWAEDWRGADMKVLLTETVFAGAATHHGSYDGFLRADLDAGGWPQTPRNEALRYARPALPLHVNGDQHLATLIHYGIDEPRDAFWSFCTPAISTVYQRWWRPDELGWEVTDRPEHDLPNTGEYVDSFGHPIFVYAVGNPDGTGDRDDRYRHAQERASGFGFVTIDRAKRTYLCEAYRFLPGHPDGEQYPGWPHTIAQADNDGREPTHWLPEVVVTGMRDPVVKVYHEPDPAAPPWARDLLYTFRIQGTTFRPHVYAPGAYTLIIGEPGSVERTLAHLEALPARDDDRKIEIPFGR